LVKIDDGNWDQVQTGEWMIEFYAPWCPACRNLQPVWEEFATWGQDLGIQVAQVDITHSPGLSGRFMITALPTIYHVKDGSYRQYRGPRSKDDFLSFVEEHKWKELDPLSTWQSPSSIPMSLISQFYRISMVLRNVMNVMTDDYGIPIWGGYLIFGGVTILIGLILGLMLVCVIDFIYPPPPMYKPPVASAKDSGKDQGKENNGNKSADDEDLEDDIINEDKDTADESQLSDVEDAEQEQQQAQEEAREEKGELSAGDSDRTRRRKVRRAD